uniref:Uncharacterized protein n=1 Tax=Glossina palpalis gambiensis TaxID=67801 RepID=A0A1B0BGQ0_9MUSC
MLIIFRIVTQSVIRLTALRLENYLKRKDDAFLAEMKNICSLFTLDSASKVDFGINTSSLKNSNEAFRKYCKLFFSFNVRRFLNVIIDERDDKCFHRNDIIDILLKIKEEGMQGRYSLKDNNLSEPQVATFLMTGSQPSALLKCNGLQENVNSQEYLSIVLDLIPDISIFGSSIDLKPFQDYALADRIPVYIPIFGLLGDLKKTPSSVNLPFGDGPHSCIGMCVALLQVKIGLVHFLKGHYFVPCKKTSKRANFVGHRIALQVKNGIILKVKRDYLYDKFVMNNIPKY